MGDPRAGVSGSRRSAGAFPLVVCAAILSFLSVATAGAQAIVTVAGGGPRGVPAAASSLGHPLFLAMSPQGDLYISDAGGSRDAVLRMDAAGLLFRVAGYAAADCTALASLGDGGPAGRACVDFPRGMAVDAQGNVYLADENHHRVRRVDGLSGLIATVAGNGSSGFHGDGLPASDPNVTLNFPSGLALDAAGNLYIDDRGNHRIRRVDAITGFITTVVGTGTRTGSIDGEGGDPLDDLGDAGPALACSLSSPRDIAIDKNGNLIISDGGNYRIRRVSLGVINTIAGDGTVGYGGEDVLATTASLTSPFQVAVDRNGNIFFGDYDTNLPVDQRVRRVDAVTGFIRTVAGGSTRAFSGDGGPATAAQLNAPSGVAVDAAGNVYIADQNNSRVRRVSAAGGVITTVAGGGDGGGYPATGASLQNPQGLTGGAGQILIAEPGQNRVRRLDLATSILTTVAGNGLAQTSGDGGPATAAGVNGASGAAADGSGDTFIAEHNGNRIRRVDAVTGVISTVAGTGTAGCGADGIPATTSALSIPVAVAVDSSGDLLIADTGCHRIRKVTFSNNLITTVAGNGIAAFAGDGNTAVLASLKSPTWITTDAPGNLFISDSGNVRIRRVDAATKIITTVAGGGANSADDIPATTAMLRNPVGIALDAAGDLFLADISSNKVRRVDAATQLITTLAGAPTLGYTGDGGPAAGSRLYKPYGVAVDAAGNVYFADSSNNRVRAVTAAPPAAGDVPDGSPASERALVVTRAPGGDLTLSWGASCAVNDTDYAIYEGTIPGFTGLAPIACTTGGATSKTFTPSAGNTFYLVAPRNFYREGSYGQRSDGTERPPSAGACLPQAFSGCH